MEVKKRMGSKLTGNLQDLFLNQLRRENIAVTIFLVNGVQLRGLIKGFDNFVVLIEVEGRQNMVYKHAISTILPLHKIEITIKEKEEVE